MKLTLEAFRGANQPFSIAFNQKSHLSIIYGENGSGKTTISDALEFLFTGTAGSLHEKSIDGKKKIPALVHAQRDKADLAVTWEDQNKSTKATISGSKAKISGPPSGRLHTLSRKNITDLIEDTPSNRFKRIQEFVSVPALENEEAQLTAFISEQKKQQDQITNNAAQVEADLDQLHESATAGKTPTPARHDWMQQILATSAESANEQLQMIEDLNAQIERLRDDFKPLKNSYSTLDSSADLLTKAEEEFAKLSLESADDFADALSTLEQAHLLFQKTKITSCPLCDTPQEHEALNAKVVQKLDSLKSLASKSTEVKKAKTAKEQAASAVTAHQGTFCGIIDKLRLTHQAAVDSEIWTLPGLVPSLLTPRQGTDLTAVWFQLLSAEAAQLAPLSSFVADQKEALNAQKSLRSQLDTILNRKKDQRKEFDILKAIITKAEAVLNILRDHRIQHANETLASISEDFAEMYQTIHPGEKIEKIKLYLHPTQKGAARFDGTLFGNENVSPVACLSESHLDTLGLCLFLALQKKENAQDLIVYLDDAIASVDEAHMERLYQLLLDQAPHFRHLIITSHYQPLRFKFRWGILTQSKADFIELGPWSLERGLTLAKGPTSEVAYLRKYVAEGEDATTIAAKSGIVLERVLDFLTGIYQCRLPRNPGAEQRWTLDHYKTGLKSEKKLLAALKCTHLAEDGTSTEHEIAPLLEDIFTRLQFRNAIGCHYKDLTSHFDEIGEALKLGSATLALVDALCDDTNELPESQKDGTSWHNKGTITRRLHPLQTPK
jgi:recombinational DNA repair ATPase RecF